MVLQVQSVLIPRNKFSLLSAKEWLMNNNYKLKKIDVTENFFRFRQYSPSRAKTFRMKTLPNDVKLVLSN